MINKNYEKVYQPNLIPKNTMDGGDIHLLKTAIVRKKMDGILPPIITRINKEGFDVEYIADGQGNKYNLMNTKGQNLFIGKDTIIEISQPHGDQIRKTLHELGWGPKSQRAVKVSIALDQVQQAIGRNSGYRWSDQGKEQSSTCIVLCDPHLYKDLLKYMRYEVTSKMDVDAELTDHRKRERNSLLNSVKWFLQNYTTYMCVGLGGNNKEFQQDAQDCLDVCTDRHRRAIRKKRLLDSLIYLRDRMTDFYKTKLERLIDTIGVF